MKVIIEFNLENAYDNRLYTQFINSRDIKKHVEKIYEYLIEISSYQITNEIDIITGKHIQIPIIKDEVLRIKINEVKELFNDLVRMKLI